MFLRPVTISACVLMFQAVAIGAPASKLSSPEAAYSILLKAETFADGAVGYVGQTPDEHYALVYLVRHKEGESYLRKLLESPNWHARLYGICGLYFLNTELFNQEVRLYSKSKAKFSHFSGCLITESTVGDIIYMNSSKYPRVVMKSPKETIDQAMDRVAPKSGDSFEWDISGGGIPAEIMKLGSN